jgi:hypothetical protein
MSSHTIPSSHRLPPLLRPPNCHTNLLQTPRPRIRFPPSLLPPPTQKPHRHPPRRIPLQTNIGAYELTPFILSAFESLDLFVGKGGAVGEIRRGVAEFGGEGRYCAEGGFAFCSWTKDWFSGEWGEDELWVEEDTRRTGKGRAFEGRTGDAPLALPGHCRGGRSFSNLCNLVLVLLLSERKDGLHGSGPRRASGASPIPCNQRGMEKKDSRGKEKSTYEEA